MKIVVFTPGLKESAIGRMAALVTRELVARGHAVTVVRSEGGKRTSRPAHDFGCSAIAWTATLKVDKILADADAVIYHIGNSYEFHEGCLHWLALQRGLVCLHDFFLGHLFYGWAETRREEASGILESWYGRDLAQRFFSHPNGQSFIEDNRVNAPLTEWICSQASGVITHSQWGTDRVLASCSGPVCVVPLAYDAPETKQRKADRRSGSNARFNLLTVGHVNPNKRVVEVIKAIGADPKLRSSVNYRLVGAIEPDTRQELTELANRLEVTLTIEGEVSKAALAQAIQDADAVACLRWPTLEAASASAIEALLSGKAIMVTDTGFYHEIRSDCAFKIAHNRENEEIQATLRQMLSDREGVETLAKRGQDWALATFTAANYADQTEYLVKESFRIEPIISTLIGMHNQLGEWYGQKDVAMLPAALAKSLDLLSAPPPLRA